jgi:hypothetical protein
MAKALTGVRMPDNAAHIFLGRVVGRTVAVEFFAHPFVYVGFVGYQVRTCGWHA